MGLVRRRQRVLQSDLRPDPDPDDPRALERVPDDERGLRGDWIFLGSEGIDDDGDGRVNEDDAASIFSPSLPISS